MAPSESRPRLGQVIGLALPIMGSMFTGIAMLIVDGIVCGHIPDNGRSLTALGFGVQIWFILDVPAAVFDVGTVALASRAHGAGDTDRVNRVVAQSAQIAFLAGAVVAVFGALMGDHLFRLLGASPEVATQGASYLKMLMIAFPASYVADGCLAPALRSVGNARLPFLCGIASNLLNAVLAYALVFGHFGLPEMGIVGAGLATAISRVASLLVMLVAIRARGVGGLIVRLRGVAIDRPIVGEILRVGLPNLVEQLTFFGSMTAFFWILARVDQTSVAAHTIGARVAGLLLVPAFGVSMATGALVGKALGAGSVDHARHLLRLSLVAVTAIMVPIALATYATSYWIAAAYDVDPGSVLEGYTVSWLHLIALSIVLQGLMLVFEGLLSGAGATRTVMKINLLANLGLRLTLAAVLALGTNLGAVGVWLSWPAALVVQLPIAFIAYRRGRWAVTGVTVAS
ncbi:MAG: efflux family protein [Myxococcales bacterium]|nr:efflux family protein [Myxococcales bacterium]